MSHLPRQIPAIEPAKVYLHFQPINRHYPQPLIALALQREPIRPLAPLPSQRSLVLAEMENTRPARLPSLQHIHQLGNIMHGIRPSNAFSYFIFVAQRLRFPAAISRATRLRAQFCMRE